MIYYILEVLCILFLLIYFYFRVNYSHWKNAGIPYLKPTIPFGNVKGAMKTIHLGFITQNCYKKLKATGSPFGGIYFFQRPVAVALSMDFVKTVLIKDFNHFQSRGAYYNEKDDPLSAHLFNAEPIKWRHLRTIVTPTFTSSKMKQMYSIIMEVANNLLQIFTKSVKHNPCINIKEILACYATDVIGTCAFGIECNSLHDPNAEFRRMGKIEFEQPRNTGLKRLFVMEFKSLARFLGIKVTQDEVEQFFFKIFNETVEYREKHQLQRNDFLDLLLKLRNNDDCDGLTKNEVIAQCFVFFLAGFETSSTTMSFCLYELAVNQDIQTKVRNEIHAVLTKYNNELTYEAMLEMPYLDQVINETLRKYPPVVNLIRQVTKDYFVPELQYTLRKDTLVILPVYAIHHDPEFYPEPDRFEPDRFLPKIIQERNNYSFLPFGDGPRNCIGLRFGLMQTRIGLITLLNKFQFTPNAQLKVPLELSNTIIVLASKDSVLLNVEIIQD